MFDDHAQEIMAYVKYLASQGAITIAKTDQQLYQSICVAQAEICEDEIAEI